MPSSSTSVMKPERMSSSKSSQALFVPMIGVGVGVGIGSAGLGRCVPMKGVWIWSAALARCAPGSHEVAMRAATEASASASARPGVRGRMVTGPLTGRW
jgi:hypothetical protein